MNWFSIIKKRNTLIVICLADCDAKRKWIIQNDSISKYFTTNTKVTELAPKVDLTYNPLELDRNQHLVTKSASFGAWKIFNQDSRLIFFFFFCQNRGFWNPRKIRMISSFPQNGSKLGVFQFFCNSKLVQNFLSVQCSIHFQWNI